MEDFLKDKLSGLESNFQDDWNVFEQKLERALFFKRMRIGAALSLFLIATSIGIFGTSSIVDFNSADEAPFGVYTEEGFESSGSKSAWDDSQKAIGNEVVFNSKEAIVSTANKENIIAPAAPKTITNKTEFIPTTQAASGNSAIADAANANDKIESSGQNPEVNNTDEGDIATANTNQAKAITNDIDRGEDVGDESEDLSITGGEADALAINTSQPKEESATPVNTADAKPAQANAKPVQADNNSFIVQTGSEKPAAGKSAFQQSSNESTTAEPEENTSFAMAEDSEASTEVYGMEQPLAVKNLKLDLPEVEPFSGNEVGDLQVRMPVPAFRINAPEKKRPFISPLQSKSLWEYSLKVYPNFTFRKFKVDEEKSNYIHRDFVDQVQASESGGFSLNIGLEISRRIGLATYLKGGLEYISYNHSANFDFTNYRTANIDPITGAITNYAFLDEPNRVVINDKNTYHYLNLPLSISYQPWATDHIRLNMEAGVSYMYFVAARGASIDYRTLEVIDLSEREFKNSLGSISLKVGATYYISPQFNLGFEPTFVYFTNTIYSDDYPFEVIPYSVGLNLKLQVKLN